MIFVEVNPAFGIAAGSQVVPASGQITLKFRIIEKLAIERDPDFAVFIAKRLITAFEIDDREPACAQGDAWFKVEPLIVRAPVSDGTGHFGERFPREIPLGIQIQSAGDSAHFQAILGSDTRFGSGGLAM
jgi:hypothetical protein